jgi:hypothetical protein
MSTITTHPRLQARQGRQCKEVPQEPQIAQQEVTRRPVAAVRAPQSTPPPPPPLLCLRLHAADLRAVVTVVVAVVVVATATTTTTTSSSSSSSLGPQTRIQEALQVSLGGGAWDVQAGVLAMCTRNVHDMMSPTVIDVAVVGGVCGGRVGGSRGTERVSDPAAA